MNPRLFVFAATLIGVTAPACGDVTRPPDVETVQINSTSLNPRVGEGATISANPVAKDGTPIPSVKCTFASSNPAVATVDATTGAVTTVSTGDVVITATCGGKTATITVTVRPRLRTLTIVKAGSGSGLVVTNPAGPQIDEGSMVQVTATASTGSKFMGFSGCSLTTSPCSVYMDGDKTITATFDLAETFATGSVQDVRLSNVTDGGCTHVITARVYRLEIVLVGSGAATTAEGTANVQILINSIGGPACTGTPFSVQPSGPLTVNGTSITGTLSTPSGNDRIAISAQRSGNFIGGPMTITEVLRNQNGQNFTSTGSANFTAQKQ